jgi:hypothetical protein
MDHPRQQAEEGKSRGSENQHQGQQLQQPRVNNGGIIAAEFHGDGGSQGALTSVSDELSENRHKSHAANSSKRKEKKSSSKQHGRPNKNKAPSVPIHAPIEESKNMKRPYEEESKNPSLPGSNAAKRSSKSSKKQKQSRKAPTDPNATPKPKRPMSAYNYFFREERARILEASRESTNVVDAALTSIDNHVPFNSRLTDQDTLAPEMSGMSGFLARDHEDGDGLPTASSRKNKRPPPHGKVTFENLGKMIAARWNAIGATALEPYTRLAKEDGARYRRELSEYYEKESDRRRDIFFPGMEGASVGTGASSVVSADKAKPFVIDVKQSSKTSTAKKNSKQGSLSSGPRGGTGHAPHVAAFSQNTKTFPGNNNGSAFGLTANGTQVTSSAAPTALSSCLFAGLNSNLQNNHQEQSAASLQNTNNMNVQAQSSWPPLQMMNMLGSLMMPSQAQSQAQSLQQHQQVGGGGLSFPSVPQMVPSGAIPSTVSSGAQFQNQGGAGNNDLLLTLLKTLQPACMPPQQQQRHFPSPGTTHATGPAGLIPSQGISQLPLQLLQPLLALQQQKTAKNVNIGDLLVLAGAMLQGGNYQQTQSQQQPHHMSPMPSVHAGSVYTTGTRQFQNMGQQPQK